MMIYEWKDRGDFAGGVAAISGSVRIMLWNPWGTVAIHAVAPSTAREIAAALLQAADAEEGVPEPVCEGRR